MWRLYRTSDDYLKEPFYTLIDPSGKYNYRWKILGNLHHVLTNFESLCEEYSIYPKKANFVLLTETDDKFSILSAIENYPELFL